jgi:hypothetical protein
MAGRLACQPRHRRRCFRSTWTPSRSPTSTASSSFKSSTSASPRPRCARQLRGPCAHLHGRILHLPSRPGCQVARESVLRFNPELQITAYHANIFSADFGLGFFEQFDLILNALDNISAVFAALALGAIAHTRHRLTHPRWAEARSHVNRMALAAGKPLIESGTAGYLGQVSVHLKVSGRPVPVTTASPCPYLRPKQNATLLLPLGPVRVLRVPAKAEAPAVPHLHHPQHPVRHDPLHHLGEIPFQAWRGARARRRLSRAPCR